MPYPDKLLTPGERVVEHVRPHWKRLVLPVLVLLLVAAVSGYMLGVVASPALRIVLVALDVVVLGTLVLAPVLRWRTTHVVLSTRRLMLRHGVLTRTARDLPLSRITDISVEQSLADRLLGSGTLSVESAGEHGPLVLADLPQVEQVQAALYELVEDDEGFPGVLGRHDADDDAYDDDAVDAYDDAYDDADDADDEGYDDDAYDDDDRPFDDAGDGTELSREELADQLYDVEQDSAR